MAAEPERFAELFNKPSIDEMHELLPREFERFVAYVLRRAGYEVKEVGPHWIRGVDLEVRLPGKSRIFAGIECKRYALGQLVTAPVVVKVKGASAVSKVGTKPFVITTSDFNQHAHQVAADGAKHAYLLNGQQLMRYIAYIRRSRNDDDNVITSISPEFFSGQGDIPASNPGGTKILTIANNKGGVGKTTTAYYLGVELARQGKRVLLIDLDGQANLTERCIPDQINLGDESSSFASIVQYFAGDRSLADLIIPTETQGVSLIPSDPFLTLRDLGGSGRPDVESRVMRDVRALSTKPIANLGGTPHWIIIDTPPAMSAFTRAALAAADYVLAPIRPRKVSLAGTRNMLRTLQTMDALTGTSGRFLGIVTTHWDTLADSKRFDEIDLPQGLLEFGGYGFQAKIPMDNQLDRVEPGAKTHGSKAYETLADELSHYVESEPTRQDLIGVTSHNQAHGK